MEEVNIGISKQFPLNGSKNKPVVLDVGCGSGALAEAIESKGYTVWGIEIYDGAVKTASDRMSKVVKADITDIPDVKSKLGQQKFDYIVFSDVLEHIYDPFTLLNEYMCFLNEGGSVVVSVPNAVAWTNRLKFLFGIFKYEDTGIMDRTHIRFFTFKTTKVLIKAAGLKITKVDYTPYFVRALTPFIKKLLLKGEKIESTDRKQLVESPLYNTYLKFFYPIEYYGGYLFKSLFAFRIIVMGKK
jgi:2-polyprenyl-3-methyl-5-hydroxy-6-metoxy-1,4-benzoquinol methylase